MRNSRKFILADEIPSHKSHFVYMLSCADGSLYTGYTTELLPRLAKHQEGKGAKYTRGRGPLALVSSAAGPERSLGLKREEAINRLNRKQKEDLIGGTPQ